MLCLAKTFALGIACIPFVPRWRFVCENTGALKLKLLLEKANVFGMDCFKCLPIFFIETDSSGRKNGLGTPRDDLNDFLPKLMAFLDILALASSKRKHSILLKNKCTDQQTRSKYW
jgi:hypothetical protein